MLILCVFGVGGGWTINVLSATYLLYTNSNLLVVSVQSKQRTRMLLVLVLVLLLLVCVCETIIKINTAVVWWRRRESRWWRSQLG
jgi:NADH:ubiquinone oxidoreductase subunit K